MSPLNDLLSALGIKLRKSVPPTADDIAGAVREAQSRQKAAEAVVSGATKRRLLAITARNHDAADAVEREVVIATRELDALTLELTELDQAFAEAVAKERDEKRAELLERHRAANREAFERLDAALTAAVAAQAHSVDTYAAAQRDLGPRLDLVGIPQIVFALPTDRIAHWRKALRRAFDPPAAVAPAADGEPEADPELQTAAPTPPPEPDESGRIAVRVLRHIDQGNAGCLMPNEVASLPAETATRLVAEGRAEFARAGQ